MTSATHFTKSPIILFLLPVAALLFHGCAPSYRGEVSRAVEGGEWENALPHLEAAVSEDSTDSWAWRELGRVRLKLDRPDEALEALRRAEELAPSDGVARIYEGIAHEKKNDWEGALASYEKSLSAEGLSFDQTREVRVRIVRATREVQKRRAVELAKQPGGGSPDDNVLAVYSFTASDTSSPYRSLRKGVAAMLITDLSNVKSLRLVERLQLETILEELHRSKGSAFDPATRARAGRLIGAARSVTGAVVTLPEDEVELQYFVLDNRNGEFAGRGQSRGRVEEVLRLEKEIVYGVFGEIGYEPTEEERAAIGKIPTTSFPAFLAFSEGIDLEDGGRYGEARSRYEQAVRLDPHFEEAKDRLGALGGAGSKSDVEWGTDAFFRNFDAAAGRGFIGSPVADRLAASGRISALLDDDGFAGAPPGGNEIPPVSGATGTISINVPVGN